MTTSESTVQWRTVRCVLAECAVNVVALTVALSAWHPATAAVAFVVIATRQHALFILYHDAVHFMFSRRKRLNDLICNAFIGVPQLLPVHMFRALHLTHHARLGREGDPERLLLYRAQLWNYRPLRTLPLVVQLLGDLLVVNNALTLLFYARERLTPGSRLRLPASRAYPGLFVLQALFAAGLGALAWVDLTTFLRFALVWFVPLLTLTPFLQKLRSYAEHADLDAPELSYSWAPGWFGRLTIWPYNINYHREHHVHSRVPWFELPARFPSVAQRPGRELPALLWQRQGQA